MNIVIKLKWIVIVCDKNNFKESEKWFLVKNGAVWNSGLCQDLCPNGQIF